MSYCNFLGPPLECFIAETASISVLFTNIIRMLLKGSPFRMVLLENVSGYKTKIVKELISKEIKIGPRIQVEE